MGGRGGVCTEWVVGVVCVLSGWAVMNDAK